MVPAVIVVILVWFRVVRAVRVANLVDLGLLWWRRDSALVRVKVDHARQFARRQARRIEREMLGIALLRPNVLADDEAAADASPPASLDVALRSPPSALRYMDATA